MTTRSKYFGLAFAILCAEILIATASAGISFIRGSMSDFLVVALIYFLIRAIKPIKPLSLAVGVFLFACAVEGLQYVHLADALHLPAGSLFYILLGNTFSLMDILMYLLGSMASFLVDVWFLNRHNRISA